MKVPVLVRVMIAVVGTFAIALGGCAKDPRIVVTPFVLKHSEPPRNCPVTVPPEHCAATAGYERACLENCDE